MADWDETSPGDSDLVSQYPANERAARSAVKTNFGVDHHEANDANVGKHEVVQIVDNAADPTIASGQVGIWNNGGKLNTRVAGGTVQRVMKGESGTKMVFYQASPPTGWTQDTTVTDRVLRVVDSAGGGTGGNWTISGVTVDNHTLTVAQIPSHTHGSGTLSTGSAGSHNHSTSTPFGITGTTGGTPSLYRISNVQGDSSSVGVNSAGAHTHSISGSTATAGGGGGHNHGLTSNGNWRPSYIDVIVATLD